MPASKRTAICTLALLVLILSSYVLPAADPAVPGHPTEIAFMTDFGLLDNSVTICRQVIYNVDPAARILDITHEVPPYSIVDGARYLVVMTPYVPKGTVFVVVIDPGVGSSRKSIVAKFRNGNYCVIPDNGLLAYVQGLDGIEAARFIISPKWMMHDAISSTFHGRAIFSPVSAHLAIGEDSTQAGWKCRSVS